MDIRQRKHISFGRYLYGIFDVCFVDMYGIGGEMAIFRVLQAHA